MNKKDFIKQLADALDSFVLHPLLFPELLRDLKQSGQEEGFLRILLARLKYLLEVGVTATRHKEFEPLEQGIYSMHLAGSGFNIRILYAFLPDRRPALLMAFYERAGHTATDYSGKCSVAAARLKELEEELT